MRIAVATGIYPPDIGGPAYYAEELRHALESHGCDVYVVTYGWIKHLPTGIRHIVYLKKLSLYLLFCRPDWLLTLDTFSVGVPAAVASMIFCVPLAIRIGGDFLWESYVERTKEEIVLPKFYTAARTFTKKEKIIFRLTKWMLAHTAAVVFSSAWQRDMWEAPYVLDMSKVYVIENASSITPTYEPYTQKNFLWHVRPIFLKNAGRMHTAFEKARLEDRSIVLEDGVLSRDTLLDAMEHCYAVVLPSLSDITPNYILDAIAYGKPFILTKYSAYAERFSDIGLFVDPLSVDDITEKIELLADTETYEKYQQKVTAYQSKLRTYDVIAKEFVKILKQ